MSGGVEMLPDTLSLTLGSRSYGLPGGFTKTIIKSIGWTLMEEMLSSSFL